MANSVKRLSFSVAEIGDLGWFNRDILTIDEQYGSGELPGISEVRRTGNVELAGTAILDMKD